MITDIRLQKFRSYTDGSFEIDPGVNIIVGPNASGKTNLLEGILISCLGSSYRAKDPELVGFNEPWARIDTNTLHGARTVKLIVEPSGVIRKEFVIYDQPLKRLLLPKTIPVVLFEPNHLQLLTGSPDLRREYLDNLLEQTVVGYPGLRRQYKRALAQRNRLLKQGPDQAGTQLFAWNIRLSQLGGEIAAHRAGLVEIIAKDIQRLYRELSHSKAKVSAEYAGSCRIDQYSSDMLHKLESSTLKDFERGFTAYGPHRDDLEIKLNGKLLQDAASRGETRTMLLALKILEMQQIENIRNQKPVLLLDDVFSELDGARRKALTEVLSGYQAFITTTDADVVVEHFLGNCAVIPLSTN
jgi:DNA replication and repair protein RecF